MTYPRVWLTILSIPCLDVNLRQLHKDIISLILSIELLHQLKKLLPLAKLFILLTPQLATFKNHNQHPKDTTYLFALPANQAQKLSRILLYPARMVRGNAPTKQLLDFLPRLCCPAGGLALDYLREVRRKTVRRSLFSLEELRRGSFRD